MTKTKRQLRAEAVERLRNHERGMRLDADLLSDELRERMRKNGLSPDEWRNAFIDLLTDDDSTTHEVESTTERGMTNIEWLYEHDEYFNSFAKLMACLHGFSTDEFTANEWLRQEHSNDDSAPEKDVSGESADVTTKQPISQFDVPKSGKTTENSTAKNEIRDFDDTREKLEADIWHFIEHNGWFGYEYEAESYADCRKAIFEIFKEWLDRQTVITERYMVDRYQNELLAMTRKRNELTAEREMYREKLSRALDLAHEIERLMP